jgi:hypothetical protein
LRNEETVLFRKVIGEIKRKFSDLTWKEFLRNKGLKFFLCLFLAFVFLLPINPQVLPYAGNDSSVFLYIGEGIINGLVPYRDIWDHKPPLIYLINAIALLVTPESRWGVFFIQVIFLAVSNWILLNLVSKRINLIWCLTVLVLFDVQTLALSHGGNLTSFYPLPFQLMAFSLFHRIQRHQNPIQLSVLASFSFLSILLLRPTSIGSFLALGIVIIIYNLPGSFDYWKKMSLGFITCSLAIAGLIFAYFAFNQALPDLWNQLYVFNRFYAGARESPERLNSLIEGMKLLSDIGLFPIAASGFVIGLWKWLVKKVDSTWVMMVILTVLAEGALLILGGRAKPPYYLASVPSLILLSTITIEKLQAVITGRKQVNLLVIPILIFIGARYFQEFQASIKSGNFSLQTKAPIIAYITENTMPSDHILVWGTESWIYFHTQRMAISKIIYVNPLFFEGYVTPDMLNGYFKQVLTAQPKIIVSTISDGEITSGFGANRTAASREMSNQIREIYEPVLKVGDSTIYRLISK